MERQILVNIITVKIKVKVRASIEILDNEALRINEIPATTTTGSLVDSIINANEKANKDKRIEDSG